MLPVQLQLCDDQDFMSQMLGASQPTPAQRQVHSDLSSGSDFEFSDLVQSSDSKADASGSEISHPTLYPTLWVFSVQLLLCSFYCR